MSKILGCNVILNESYQKKDESIVVINSIECYCEVTDRRESVIGANIQKYVLNPKDIPAIFNVPTEKVYVRSEDGEKFMDVYIKNLLRAIIGKDCIFQSVSKSYNNIVRDTITEIYFKEQVDIPGQKK